MRRVRCVALAALVALVGTPLGAQAATDIPLAEIPERLPGSLREPLRAERRLLEARIDAFNAFVPDFLARCGQMPADATARMMACKSELAGIEAQQRAIVADKAVLRAHVDTATTRFERACVDIDAQLARDREALRRQQRVNESAVGELEDWARMNEEAQRSAVMLGVKSLMGEAANRLLARQARVTTLQAAIARNERLLGERGIPVGPVRERLATLALKYDRAQRQAAAGAALARSGEAEAIYGLARTEAGVIATQLAAADEELARALADPAFEAIIARDASAADLARSALDLAAATPGFERLAPQYALAAFIVDYGYDATRWSLSAQRILQGDALSAQALEAVAALTRQIRRTIEWRDACRTAP